MKKLYVVLRADLDGGDQIAQAGHAVAVFARKHRELFEGWTDGPNNLVVLAIADEWNLSRLQERIAPLAATVRVHEPDLHDELTAIAFAGTDAAARLVSSLPLALRKPKTSTAA